MVSLTLITKAEKSDAAQIALIGKENLLQNQTGDLAKSGFLVRPINQALVEEFIADEKHIVLVAKQNDEVVGYLISCALTALEGEILDAVLDLEEVQKTPLKKILYHKQIAKKSGTKNVGKPLVQGLIAEAKKQNFELIACRIIHAPQNNEVSIALHSKLGFELKVEKQEDEFLKGIYLLKLVRKF